MPDIENEAVEQETAQEVASPLIEAAENDSEETQAEEKSNRAFSEMRRANKELTQENKLQKEMMQQLMANQRLQPQQVTQPEEDIIQELSREEYVPGEKVAKGFRKLEERFDKRVEEIEKKYASQQQTALFNELKREFPDFDSVVNSETLALLEETNPRLARTIAASNNPYAIAIQSYEYIKAKGLSSKAPVSKRSKEIEAKIEQNKKSVNTPQAFDKRPMAQAFTMSDAMKKELAAEMYGYAQHAGMGY